MIRSMLPPRLCSSAFAATVLLAAAATAGSPQELSPAQMRGDLTYLRGTWAQKDRSFSPAARDEFAREARALEGQLAKLTPSQFALELARLVAIGGNGHTILSLPTMDVLPIRLWWFDDGLYIVSADQGHAQLVGAKVVRIGKQSADQAETSVAAFIPGNDEHRRVLAPALLRNPIALQRAGVVKDAREVQLTLVDRDGKRRRVKLNAQTPIEPESDDTWQVLVPDGDAPDRWPHVLDGQRRPAAFGTATDLAYDWVSSAPRVLYVRSNQIQGMGDARLDMKLVEMTMKELVDDPPQNVIVDLRFNMGGNFLNTILFAQALPKLVAPDGKVLVLTGPVTFSAALVTAAMLKSHGDGNVVFVGGHMGDYDRFWAEGRNLKLPNSGWSVRYNDGFHDWSGPCNEPECLWATRIFGPQQPTSLEPDVRVPMTFADYSRGVDAAFDRAFQLATSDTGNHATHTPQ
jgi:hypothetical protein